MVRAWFPTLALAMLVVPAIDGSSGDEDPKYRSRVDSCSARCPAGDAMVEGPRSAATLVNAMRRGAGWSCAEECLYTAMHEHTAERVAAGQDVLQYFGKWPFWRLGGLQEPGSVFFSLLNLLAHYRGLKALGRVPTEKRSLAHGCYVGLSWVSMNAWLWASVFHSRDRPVTEALDYHSATAVQFAAAVSATVRVFELSPTRSAARGTAKSAVCTPCNIYMAWSGADFASMLYGAEFFDYGYNMKVNLGVALLGYILWVCWLLIPCISSSHPQRAAGASLGVFLCGMGAAILLEVFDFADLRQCLASMIMSSPRLSAMVGVDNISPWQRVWGGLDAHALWHAATAINTPLWYQFTTHDVTDARGTGESVAGSDRFRCFRSQAKMLVELEAKKENK